PPPPSTRLPYTTLFRSPARRRATARGMWRWRALPHGGSQGPMSGPGGWWRAGRWCREVALWRRRRAPWRVRRAGAAVDRGLGRGRWAYVRVDLGTGYDSERGH